MIWTAQINDLVGGFIVTNLERPLSGHDHRPEAADEDYGYVIADCMDRPDATTIARLLNEAWIERPTTNPNGVTL